MASTDELRAELAVRELEEQLLAAKDSDGASTDLKLALRDARRAHREIRSARPAGPDDARPATIEASTGVEL